MQVNPCTHQIVTLYHSDIHLGAGEWISGATCMYVANKLVDEFKNGNELVREVPL